MRKVTENMITIVACCLAGLGFREHTDQCLAALQDVAHNCQWLSDYSSIGLF